MATYTFYWLLAILELVEEEQQADAAEGCGSHKSQFRVGSTNQKKQKKPILTIDF